MRRSRRIGTVWAATLALVLLAAGTVAGSAAAAKSSLILKAGGKGVTPGSPADELLTVSRAGETCLGEGFGTLESNDQVKDRLSFPSFWERSGCQGNDGPGYRISRLTTSVVTIASNGSAQVKFAPKLAVTIPGGCVYEFAKLKLTFTSGYTQGGSAAVPGKLGKKSPSGCAPEESFQFGEALSDAETFTLYEMEAAS
jgi:hypothetical protein